MSNVLMISSFNIITLPYNILDELDKLSKSIHMHANTLFVPFEKYNTPSPHLPFLLREMCRGEE